jgi:glycosyltransferase involved in cell wall biosynthesis
MTDPLGQSQVLPYLTGLSARGYHITLISCEKPERLAHKNIIEQICKDAGIAWHPIGYTRKPPVLSTIRDVQQLGRLAEQLHGQQPFQIVHCRSYIAALIGMGMKRRLGTKFLFDMRGFWADERVDGGLWQLNQPLYKVIYKFFKRKEKQFLEAADAVISLTYSGKEEIATWALQRQPDITVIPCCVDTTLFDPSAIDSEEQDAARRKVQLPYGRTVLGYVGSLGTWYQLPEMLAFFQVWLLDNPTAVLLFVTTESEKMIFDEAKAWGVPGDNIRIIAATRKEMPIYISLMDYGIFFLKQAYSKKASSPVKQGEMMAMGIPVICNAGVGDSDRIVLQYDAGLLVHNYNTAGYEAVISELNQKSFSPAVIRAGSIDYFDLAKGIDQYESLYEKLCFGTI